MLIQFERDRFNFDDLLRIDLENNKDENNKFIRNIMEFLTDECRSKHRIKEVASSFKRWKFWENVKGIEASEAIATILDIATLNGTPGIY